MAAIMFERATASKALAMSTIFFTSTSVYLDVLAEGLGGRKLSSRTLLTSQTMFKKFFPEMLLGLGLIYIMRQVERTIGTRRYVAFCMASTTISVSLQLVLLSQLGGSLIEENKSLATGPYAPIFSLLVLYFAYVPAIGMPVGAFKMNHKIPVYLMAFLLASQEGKTSFIPACCAVVAGVICMFQLKKLVLPEPIARFGSKYLDPLLRSSDMGARFPRGANQGFQGRGFGGAAFGGEDNNGAGNGGPRDDVLLPTMFGGPPPSAAVNIVPEPQEEDVQTLVGMGFAEAAARNALRRNRNDVNRAAESLLNAM